MPQASPVEMTLISPFSLLDTLHLVFAIHMIYFYLLKNFGDPMVLNHAIWYELFYLGIHAFLFLHAYQQEF